MDGLVLEDSWSQAHLFALVKRNSVNWKRKRVKVIGLSLLVISFKLPKFWLHSFIVCDICPSWFYITVTPLIHQLSSDPQLSNLDKAGSLWTVAKCGYFETYYIIRVYFNIAHRWWSDQADGMCYTSQISSL